MISAKAVSYTEGYRSGHNEAVLKTVWAHAHTGSNPFPSAIKSLENTTFLRLFSFCRFPNLNDFCLISRIFSQFSDELKVPKTLATKGFSGLYFRNFFRNLRRLCSLECFSRWKWVSYWYATWIYGQSRRRSRRRESPRGRTLGGYTFRWSELRRCASAINLIPNRSPYENASRSAILCISLSASSNFSSVSFALGESEGSFLVSPSPSSSRFRAIKDNSSFSNIL